MLFFGKKEAVYETSTTSPRKENPFYEWIPWSGNYWEALKTCNYFLNFTVWENINPQTNKGGIPMSKESAMKFLDQFEKDPAFRAGLQKAKNSEERKKILEKSNLHFTKKEWEDAFAEKYKKPLSQEELQKISGGVKGLKIGSKEDYKKYLTATAGVYE